ncbi:MAG: transposase [Deltaproteobacteria bacterium]|nr:transposase [Deltaproteobacteria bacterium]MBW2301719.1 transposase [Deltaproteobacteria bacterium]
MISEPDRPTLGVTFPHVNLSYHPFSGIKDGLARRLHKFWTGGYFYRTVGAVNSETVSRYVEHSQSKHWEVNTGIQKQLLEFTAN